MNYLLSLSFLSLGVFCGLSSCAQRDIEAEGTRTAEEAKGKEVGADVEQFTALNQFGKEFSLNEALEKGPVVMIFYRGQWCPICNQHLSNLQDSLSLIEAKGATVIAISPEKQEYLQKTEEKTGATFTLLSDDGFKISDAFDLTFTPGAGTRLMYNTALGADLKHAQTDDSQRLPIPATYVIGQDSKVIWRQFDPDYKNRSTVKEILEALD